MFNYSLDIKNYTWTNALFWGNCFGHCKKAWEGSCGNRLVHILIAIAEFFPILSQIASIFEKLIVTNCDTASNPRSLPSLSKRNVSQVSTKSALPVEPERELHAATKIQKAYRRHRAYMTSRKQKDEKPVPQQPVKAPIAVQTKTTRVPVEKGPTLKPFACELHFPDDRQKNQSVQIRQASDMEALLKQIEREVSSRHRPVCIYFDFDSITRDEESEKLRLFQTFSAARPLEFSFSRYANRTIDVRPQPIKSEEIGNGTIRRTYANGVIEEFLRDKNQGVCIFPDGTKENGEFHVKSGILIHGYRITANRQIEFVDPTPLASWKQKGENELWICEVEGELVVIEKTMDKYTRSHTPIETVLFNTHQRGKYGVGESIKKVLAHPSFAKQRQPFIDSLLAGNETGALKLLMLSNTAILDILEMGKLDPLKIIDPVSKRNAFVHIAYYCKDALDEDCQPLFNRMFEVFPAACLATGHHIVETLLIQGHLIARRIAKMCTQRGVVFDRFHQLWFTVAKNERPDVHFIQDFSQLSAQEKDSLYNAAFLYNNPYIHEPADRPITPEQYSINLMWINKDRMPPDQEFLFGSGSTAEELKRDFQKKFVIPVSNWAKKNPGSLINIWIDSAMATPRAIERSKQALEMALQGAAHGHIQFRDVRSVDVVQANPSAFTAAIPIYFRVDLLRAAVADFTLRKKETQFFVYGDIDMEPLSGAELFDKRTVHFLNDLGFVMAKGGHLGFENGFQILNGAHPQFMDSHRKVIVDLSIQMVLEVPHKIKEQQIYDTYPAMITHLLDADGRYGKRMLREGQEVRLSNYRYDFFQAAAHTTLPLGEKRKRHKLKDIMPRKPVKLPPSHF